MKAGLKKILRRAIERSGGCPPVNDRIGPDHRSQDYFVQPGYQPRAVPKYFDDFGPGEEARVYQPDVYALADVMASLGAHRIIDVGCGKAMKLLPLADRHEVIGLDFGANIEYCRTQHARGRWIVHDIVSDGPLPLGDVDLPGAVVICADVIEHLTEPVALLRKLKACSDKGACVLLSTPERELVYGGAQNGPPRNPAHVREWTMGELRALLHHVGFEIPMMGLTANDSVRRELSTILAVLTTAAATVRP